MSSQFVVEIQPLNYLQMILRYLYVYNVTDNSSDLQQSIDKLVDWSKWWQLPINLNKCYVLPIFVLSLTQTLSVAIHSTVLHYPILLSHLILVSSLTLS